VIKMTSSPAARETQPIGSSGGETSPEAVAWGPGVEDMNLAGPAGALPPDNTEVP